MFAYLGCAHPGEGREAGGHQHHPLAEGELHPHPRHQRAQQLRDQHDEHAAPAVKLKYFWVRRKIFFTDGNFF